jgi:NADH-quinone oxidoreductase subunit J
MVLFLFVLMLLNLNNATEPQKSNAWKVTGAIAAGSLLVVMVGALKGSTAAVAQGPHKSDVGLVENLGKVLFTDFVVPFEIAGILFLAAMVGAVLVGKRDTKL